MSKFLIFFTLLFLSTSSNALVWLDIGAGIVFGEGDWKEVNESQTPDQVFTHDYSSGGFELTAKAGVDLLWIYAGGVGSFSRMGLSGSRKQTSETDGLTTVLYSTDVVRTLYGAHGAIQIPGTTIRLFGEYYPSVETEVKDLTISFSDSTNPNIFSKGDVLKGSGIGAGIFYQEGHFSLTVTLRQIEYDTFIHTQSATTTTINLPTNEYPKKLKFYELMGSIGIGF